MLNLQTIKIIPYDNLELKHLDYVYAAQRELRRIYGGDTMLMTGQISYLFCETPDEIYGCIVFHSSGHNKIWIQTIYVNADQREKGIMRLMLDELRVYLPDYTFALSTAVTNKRMQKAMNCLGWDERVIQYE